MPQQYWYFYFPDKRDRNSFVEKVDKDEDLKSGGVHAVNVTNELTCECYWCQRDRKEYWFTIENGVRKEIAHFVYLAVLSSGSEELYKSLSAYFKDCKGHREERHDSPYEF